VVRLMKRFCQYFAALGGHPTVALALLTVGLIGSQPLAWAIPADRFPPNPLELKTPDPLPAIESNLAQLNQQALAQLQAGDDKAAFDLWNRELRLSRSLGPVIETRALARVGTIAWEKNNTQQVRYISQRLQQIQTENKTANTSLLTELATAYQGIRAPELAVNVQQTLLQEARQKADPLGEFRAMNAIGQTHLDWFGYERATKTYQELLEQARGKSDRPNQIAYLYQLAYIHEQNKNAPAAASALQELMPLYTEVLRQQILQNPTGKPSNPSIGATNEVPNVLAYLQIRLGNNAATSQQPNLAELAYQSAYNTAQSQVQLGYAGDALRQLGKFYRSQKRYDAAVQVYDFLSDFEQDQTQNLYNAMDAYDQMGQVFLENQQKEKALAAFQRGLLVAQALSYRTGYFGDRISELQGKGK
jgi:tetratricopeptide (TPR) repeat protein